MKRDPSAILTSHKMDPERRELYVEGARDVRFFTWLSGSGLGAQVRIVPADFVDLHVDRGGNRGKLVALAEELAAHQLAIRIFVDADFDRLLGVAAAPLLTLTDLRDLEGYLLNAPSLEKVLRLGLKCDSLAPDDVVAQISSNARRLGLLRLASLVQNWNLPFQDTDLHRHVKFKDSKFVVDETAFVQALFQNANRSLKDRPTFLEHVEALSRVHYAIDDLQLAHGKDVLVLTCALCHSLGCHRDAAEPILWSSVERGLIRDWPALSATMDFLAAA